MLTLKDVQAIIYNAASLHKYAPCISVRVFAQQYGLNYEALIRTAEKYHDNVYYCYENGLCNIGLFHILACQVCPDYLRAVSRPISLDYSDPPKPSLPPLIGSTQE